MSMEYTYCCKSISQPSWLVILAFLWYRECWSRYPCSPLCKGLCWGAFRTNLGWRRTLNMAIITLIVVEAVGYLIHNKVGIFEEAEKPIIDLSANAVLVLLQTEAAKEEVLHPMIIYIHNEAVLNYLNVTISSFTIIFSNSTQHDQKQGKLFTTSRNTILASWNFSCSFNTRPYR